MIQIKLGKMPQQQMEEKEFVSLVSLPHPLWYIMAC
jgi:hypothetical protein